MRGTRESKERENTNAVAATTGGKSSALVDRVEAEKKRKNLTVSRDNVVETINRWLADVLMCSGSFF